MRTKQEIQHAINVANEIKEIIESNFEHVPLYKDTPRVFGFQCKIDNCKEKVGRIERLEHLQKKHNLPYFFIGAEALNWVLEVLEE